MPESEALDAAIHVLRLTQEAIPSRWDEDTADELLTLVQLTFHDFVVDVLAEPLPSGEPDGEAPPLATRAAMHGRAIADLLVALTINYWRGTGSELSEIGLAEAPVKLRTHWIDTIAEAAASDERPEHETGVQYVRGVAQTLSIVTRILSAERGLSLDPADPRGPIEPVDDAMTGEDAGGLLVWCGAAALCIAATLQPEFRIASD
jgi:hypothetical protein